MKYFLSVLFIFPLFIFAQKNDLPERQPYTLHIAVDKTNEYTDSIKHTPFVVHADIIQLYPGESIFVKVDETNGTINSIKTVKENKNPEKTIIISFKQLAEQHVHQSMMLQVFNPFKKELQYSSKIFLMNSKRWADTNVLPVDAGLSSFETWPDVIISIALSDWKFK